MALWSIWTQYFPPKPTFTEANLSSQKGRVFIVTGGNAGVGFELCKMLYAADATVYMGSRSEERASAAIRQITSESPKSKGKLVFLRLDLNDLASVKDAAAAFAAKETKLDVLWNNAGAGALSIPLGSKTAQGTEAFMGMHCVGPLLFSKMLLPQLHTAVRSSNPGKVRVVWTASLLAEMSSPTNGVDFSLLEQGPKSAMQAYSATKAGNYFLAVEWARRYGAGETAMVSVAQNPGNLRTGMFKGTPGLWMLVLNRILYPAKMGAYTELFAGLSPDITIDKNGAYIMPWGRIQERFPRADVVDAMKPEDEGGKGATKKFWEWCESKHLGFESK
ncbi:MAG: hypothetical protein M1822_002353 [Bathelium mastoideum]|nr:MAG: hypothetical protein M1822_002353 [Bathelium mastoideum]